MLATKLLSTISGGAEGSLYVDDVFSALTYTGVSSTGTRQFINGIDLTKGGLVWIKDRGVNGWGHRLIDTVRGGTNYLSSNTTAASAGDNDFITSFNSDGYTIGRVGLPNQTTINYNSDSYVIWAIRKATKFFDVVTYVGNGTASRPIDHSLNCVPGLIIVKATSTAGDWYAVTLASVEGSSAFYYKSNSTTAFGINSVNAANGTMGQSALGWSSEINICTIGRTELDVNTSGVSYTAYLFAHDTSADGIIQCSSFTTDGAGGATVNLGWEPQYVMVKTVSSSGGWRIYDASRGMTAHGTGGLELDANSATVEAADTGVRLRATGFTWAGAASQIYVYLAIRRPNKPPTIGTQVYNAIVRTGTGAAARVTGVGFAPDACMVKNRGSNENNNWQTRLTGGGRYLLTNGSNPEVITANTIYSFDGDGVSFNNGDNQVNSLSWTYVNHFFRRAPGVFDVVCYRGTGVQGQLVSHNLSVVPELIIIKSRSNTGNWYVWSSYLSGTYPYIGNALNTLDGNPGFATLTTAPSANEIALDSNNTGGSLKDYIAYLFATKAGISKVGSYTGNGSSKTIDCGFTTGARFVLIKRTDSTGDWYVWDTARGIVSANDPHLSLNNLTAEVTTDDSIDPASVGFVVNQVTATNINVNLATYIYLSFA